MAATTQDGQQAEQRPPQQTPSPAAAEAGLERVMFAVREGGDLQESHIRAIAIRSHAEMLSQMGGPEGVVQALETLKQSGAISEGMATIYREALTAAGTDSSKFADTIIQRRNDIARTIDNDMGTSPGIAISILDNTDKGMSAEQIQGRAQLAYQSLLMVSNNDMATLNATIDRAVENGQLNAQNAVVIRNAAQQAGTDAARFAQLVSENKDGLAQLAVIQASQPGQSGPASGLAGLFGGDMSNNPMMQFINTIIMAFTGGQMNLESLMGRVRERAQGADAAPQTAAPGGQPPGQTAAPETATADASGARPAGSGVTSGPEAQPQGGTDSPAAEAPASEIVLTGYSGLGTGAYSGFSFMNDDYLNLGYGLDDPLLNSPLLTNPSIFRTTFRDDPGFSFGATPRVNLLAGDMSINGMSPTSRFGMLSNPDPLRISLIDPTLDTSAPRLSESFDRGPEQTSDVVDVHLKTGGLMR